VTWTLTVVLTPVFFIWFGQLVAASLVLVLLYGAWLILSGPVIVALVTVATDAFSEAPPVARLWLVSRQEVIGAALWPLGPVIALLWLLSFAAGGGRRERTLVAAGAVDAFWTVVFTAGLVLPLVWIFALIWAPLRLWSAGHPEEGGRGGLQPPLPALLDG
jgi:hypothetical protein